ncbi:MAG TPA: hypothetical protein VL995_04085 [Cellvibrio sp.]|nr:hypothetical protein [Cellvibrio sp.]
MVEAKLNRTVERLRCDVHAAFGERIPFKTLCKVLGFNSIDALKRAIRGGLDVTIHSDLHCGERYIQTDELLELLVHHYLKVADAKITNRESGGVYVEIIDR